MTNPRRIPLLPAAALALLSLSTGCFGPDAPQPQATVQEIRTASGGYVGLDILVTDGSGTAIPCGEGTVDVTLEVSDDDGASFRALPGAAVHLDCVGAGKGDVALVVDNSGSEANYLDELKEGARNLAAGVVPAGGRVSLTRVSTDSSIELALSGDASEVDAAIDAMHVANGWTALYDGVRMGNETLGGARADDDDAGTFSDAAAFCAASRKMGIVAFTDGRENNSAAENASGYDQSEYPGDGIDTTLADLYNLRVDDVTTPIYTIGLGNQPAHDDLRALADATGGRHMEIDDPADLANTFAVIGDYLGSTHQVCADLDTAVCGDVTVRLSYTWTDGTDTVRGTKEVEVHVPCVVGRSSGRSATILLTMSNPGIDQSVADTLISNTVDWASPTGGPRVLVVQDDNHHNEFVQDTEWIRSRLASLGYDVTSMVEPASGIEPTHVAGYDVVWFSNPGYPMDDQTSFETLRMHLADGGGLILQGDDMTASFGKAFDMTPLTHLEHRDNGTQVCGKRTDNNRDHRYTVSFTGGHPVTAGLEDVTFEYGDDIDLSVPVGAGEVVVGEADFSAGNCTSNRPVVVVHAP